MVEFTPNTMEKLAELLKVPEPEVLQGEDMISSGCEITSSRGELPPADTVKGPPRTIEEFEEQEAKEAEELGRVGAGIDDRKIPEYTMCYRQAVTAEDVFLQIGPKTPSSNSCEDLIVRIKLPGDKKENTELTVDRSSIFVHSSQHALKLDLPHEIDPDLSKANWDSAEETLVLTLRLQREFDYVNF
ncbi:hypothetical protein MSG28_002264 [Choristoneura fumiferana]|uniref:Uncharacterized protein n=1 Tax=Choristoneura fumiferana TaxID=7141 RepID=A0ACC0JVD3_CHOFU|nr:hypothetical protein MSG28_002264 [Choristoneura fumiferana]